MRGLTKFRIWLSLVMILILILAFICFACDGGSGSSVTSGTPKTNFVIVLTDDQRWDTLWAMPITQDKLEYQGVRFNNAFVSAPICSPTRAGLLSGGLYAHNTGILTNTYPNGGAKGFHDTETLATRLQNVGYKTALIGKYLNGYDELAPYIPPGWTKFVVKISGIKNPFYVVGSSGAEPAQGDIVGPIEGYDTDFFKDRALEFLDQNSDSPFFLLLSTNAPHYPALPARGDKYSFSDFVYRDRAYGEVDLSDKPGWVRRDASDYSDHFGSVEQEDEFHRDQLRSLQAVDRSVGEIIEKITEIGKLNQTMFFFSSDNGYMWGEHRLFKKEKPYEESIRVPFLVVMPGIASRTYDHLVSVDIDIGSTVVDVVGLSIKTDGLSLIPLLENSDTAWREELLIQMFGCGDPKNTWAGLRTKEGVEEWKYVEYSTGEIEFYDLLNDPYEEESKHNDPDYQDIIAEFASHLAPLKGLNLFSWQQPPEGRVGEQYSFQLKAWGGEKPYTWRIIYGQLPEGLFLDTSTGFITGIPIWAEDQKVRIKIEDSSIAKHTGMPQSCIRDYNFTIK